jgi:Protein of unknown function (DUF2934)
VGYLKSRLDNQGGAVTEHSQPLVEEITRRAYGLYLERGGDHGSDVQDWVQAEKELGAASDAEKQKPQARKQTATRQTKSI